MMKFFTNKKIWEKVILALLFVMLFQFAVMQPVQADVVEFAGKLTSPILSLLVTLGDGIINILHTTIMGVDTPLIHVESDAAWWEIFSKIASAVITVACVIGAVVATGGLALILGGIAVFSAASYLMGGDIVQSALTEGVNVVASMFGSDGIPEDIYLPAYTYSPEEIFKGNILLFNVNFFRDPIEVKEKTHEDEDGNTFVDYWYYEDEDGNEVKTSKQDSAEVLQSTVSTWYNAIRNICLVVMLSVLVYIGIRILLSSVASDRAKYVTMLKDWFIGLCLLFLMHYIMAFSVTIVDKITKLVSTSVSNDGYQVYMEKTDNLDKTFEELGLKENTDYVIDEDGDGDPEYYVWTSNLMGYLRLKLQMNSPGGQYVGEAICFLVLVVFTVMFTFTYLRRLLYMAFLTLIAPMVALTYCIDKLNDGSAQGFNKWFKEYIFNLLIQPMHLLLYYILITSAFSTLGDNVIYSIVAIGFMIPAEKLLRSLFGFEKASTPSALGGAAATSLMMTGINKLTGMAGKRGKSGKGSDGSGSSTSSDNDTTSLRTHDVDSTNEMLGEGEDSRGNSNVNEEERNNAALEKYRSEGYGQNANGEYYNPWTDEYDADYNPTKDESYNPSIKDNDNNDNERISENNIPQEQKRERFRGAKRLGRATLSAVGTGAKRKIKALPRTMKGVAFGAAVGTAAMAAGTAVAVASGDPGKVGTAATAAIGGGYLAGRSAANSRLSDNISPEVKDAFNRMYNSPEYKEEIMEKQIKELKKDETIRQKMKAADLDVKEMMKKGGNFEQFTRNGVDDIDDIIAAQKLIDKGVFNNVDHATAVIQNDKRMGRNDPNKMSKKTRDEWKGTFKEEYLKAGASEAKANSTVDNTMNLVHELHKAKK